MPANRWTSRWMDGHMNGWMLNTRLCNQGLHKDFFSLCSVNICEHCPIYMFDLKEKSTLKHVLSILTLYKYNKIINYVMNTINSDWLKYIQKTNTHFLKMEFKVLFLLHTIVYKIVVLNRHLSETTLSNYILWKKTLTVYINFTTGPKRLSKGLVTNEGCPCDSFACSTLLHSFYITRKQQGFWIVVTNKAMAKHGPFSCRLGSHHSQAHQILIWPSDDLYLSLLRVAPTMIVRWYWGHGKNLRDIVRWLKDFNYRGVTLQLPQESRKMAAMISMSSVRWWQDYRNCAIPEIILTLHYNCWGDCRMPEKSCSNRRELQEKHNA